ncbi:TonB-dependent siderophore receptor [Achromobacter veterisilvae]|uniref:TonB-dependent siderophore receptor n=1 Tax=Achromobacter veterisilvae TaxID=2069367 RepID=A0ABZ2RYE7_9BURK
MALQKTHVQGRFALKTLSMALGAAATGPAHAQVRPADATPLLAPVTVQADAPPYKAERVQSGKFTEPLLDTPQSITVVPRAVLEEQQAQSLQDVLRNVPGITFSSGEGNLGWGDMFTIRGFSAEQSITVDGIRDAGLSSRTDIFNLEQAEVFKGTGSIESGVSAVGGSVNLASKEARLGSFYKLSGGLGTDRYRRITADLNQELTDSSALRINLMRHHNAVAERDVTEFDRSGMAASLAMGLGTPTRVTLNYLHQEDDNIPDGGVPILRGTGGRRMPHVSRNAWYGDPGLYTEQTRTDQATLKAEHDFTQAARLSNISRWQQTDRIGVLAPARFNSTARTSYGYAGTGPLVDSADGIPSYSGYAPIGDPSPYAQLRGNDFGTSKRYTILANQTNLNLDFHTGGIKHSVATGVEFYKETYGDHARTIRAPSLNPVIDLRDTGGVDMGGVDTLKGDSGNQAEVFNAGLYASDTLTLSPQWMLQGALRYDRYRVTQTTGAATRRVTDGAWSGRLGVTYKPVDSGSIYVSYSQAAQPSALGASTNNNIYGATGPETYEPAVSRTWELGTKWDLADGDLSLTGAVFRTELSDSWEYGDDATDVVRALPAKRVDGIELGLSGSIAPRWSAFAGVSALKSRITKGANQGEEARNVPDLTFNLWTTYAATEDLSLSYGAQYVGKRRYTDNKYVGGKNNNSATVSGPSGTHPVWVRDNEKAPSYWLHSAAARYRVDKNATLGVNVDNLFNKFYYSRVGASLDGFQLYGVPGAGRTFTFTADLSF